MPARLRDSLGSPSGRCSNRGSGRAAGFPSFSTPNSNSAFTCGNAFFDQLEGIFAKPDFTKAEIVSALEAFLPNFRHEEKGKNLDQKM